MSIGLITDGMLGGSGTYTPPQPPPSGPPALPDTPTTYEATFEGLPHAPCAPTGLVEPIPPAVPIGTMGTGNETTPHVPCDVAGGKTDPPPSTPRLSEGNKIPTISTPRDPRGSAT